jgi:hypothetical protein
MASEINLNLTDDRPLVGDVEVLGSPLAGHQRGRDERDESIIRLLRDKLKDRDSGNPDATLPARPRRVHAEGEDKYEPQRLSRKICWQYDSSAHKVPLLRRHYI